jgi:hypothetical protein
MYITSSVPFYTTVLAGLIDLPKCLIKENGGSKTDKNEHFLWILMVQLFHKSMRTVLWVSYLDLVLKLKAFALDQQRPQRCAYKQQIMFCLSLELILWRILMHKQCLGANYNSLLWAVSMLDINGLVNRFTILQMNL